MGGQVSQEAHENYSGEDLGNPVIQPGRLRHLFKENGTGEKFAYRWRQKH